MGEYVFEFGQHIGKKISVVPSSYLKWVIRELEEKKGSTQTVKDCIEACEIELENRGEDYE